MKTSIEPLRWPGSWPRTAQPKASSFAGDRTATEAAQALVTELSARCGPPDATDLYPDRGGDVSRMAEINTARDEALTRLRDGRKSR